MCLGYKETLEVRKNWLAEQPDMITAYKVVNTSTDVTEAEPKWRLYPLYDLAGMQPKQFKRKNRLRKTKNENKILYTRYISGKCTTYIAYYHFYESRYDAELLAFSSNGRRVIECRIPKELVTNLGQQNGKLVIIARGFDIVGEDYYFGEVNGS